MPKKIIGILKFSDFDSTNGVSHYNQLKSSKVFFNKPDFFGNYGTSAQSAIEGTTDFINFVKEKESRTKECITIGNSIYRIAPPIGLNYKFFPNVLKSIYGSQIGDDEFFPNRLNQQIAEMKKVHDIVIYPSEYEIKNGTPEYYPNKGLFEVKNYNFKSTKIEFCNNDKTSTWRLASFVYITLNDIDTNRNLKNSFINDLVLGGNKRKGIALDKTNNFRPWVYIPYCVFIKCLCKLRISGGVVKYYQPNKYPFSINDILEEPNCLLLAKDDSYEEQHEFRLIIGGPNKNFITNQGPLISLGWENSLISYGKNYNSLKNLKINY